MAKAIFVSEKNTSLGGSMSDPIKYQAIEDDMKALRVEIDARIAWEKANPKDLSCNTRHWHNDIHSKILGELWYRYHNLDTEQAKYW